MCRWKERRDTSPGNQTGPPAGCSSSAASEGAARSLRVAATSGGTADDVGQALPTEEARVGQKRKKDDTLKTTGIREGEKRKFYSIFYRYAVVLKLNEFKEKGDKTPTDSTANMFGVHKSCVSKWNKQADQLRQALQNRNRQMPGHADHVSDEHPSAKRIYLGPERHKGASMWPRAEELVYREYKRRREKGLRVTHHSIRVLMRVNLKKYYGEDVSDPQQLLSFVGTAQAPSVYKILESCRSLETDENLQNLIGTKILHAWDDKDRQGWFEGRVHGRNLNARAPTPNFFFWDTASR